MEQRKQQAEQLKQINDKYANDLEYREKIKKIYREKYQNDPDYKAKTLERAKNRYHTDPEYRKATIERAKARNQRKKDNTNKGKKGA